MEFTVEAKTISQCVAKVAPVVDTRSLAPICRTIRIAAQKRLTLTATSMATMTRIDVSADAEIAKDGVICVDADDFRRWAAALPSGGQVTFSLGDDDWSIAAKCGRYRHTFRFLAPDDFPSIDGKPPAKKDFQTVDAERLLRNLTAVGKFCAREKTRYYLGGIRTELGGAMVATDGHRLHTRHMDGLPDALIPSEALRFMSGALDGADFADIASDANAVFIRAGDCDLRFAQIDGEYPEWRRITPEPPKAAIFSRDEMLEALKAITLGVGGFLKIKAEAEEIAITHARQRDAGKASQTMGSGSAAVDAEVLIPFERTINSDYLADGVAAMPTGAVVWEADTSSDVNPNVFRPLDDEDRRTLCVIMGMRG